MVIAPYVSVKCDTCYSCTLHTTGGPQHFLVRLAASLPPFSPPTTRSSVLAYQAVRPSLLSSRPNLGEGKGYMTWYLIPSVSECWIHLAAAASSCTALSPRSVSWTTSYEEVCGVGVQYRHNTIYLYRESLNSIWCSYDADYVGVCGSLESISG